MRVHGRVVSLDRAIQLSDKWFGTAKGTSKTPPIAVERLLQAVTDDLRLTGLLDQDDALFGGAGAALATWSDSFVRKFSLRNVNDRYAIQVGWTGRTARRREDGSVADTAQRDQDIQERREEEARGRATEAAAAVIAQSQLSAPPTPPRPFADVDFSQLKGKGACPICQKHFRTGLRVHADGCNKRAGVRHGNHAPNAP